MERYLNLNGKNYVINLDDAKDRLIQTRDTLGHCTIPFTRFPAIKHEVGLTGCGMSHRAVLDYAVVGTAIFEDDIKSCSLEGLWKKIPEGTDAVYLGISNHGYIGKPFGVRDTVLASRFNEDFIRIHNMCSLHAVLYLSLDYINACRESLDWALRNDFPCDLATAMLHKDFQILTPNKPWFYQEPQPEFTNFELKINYDPITNTLLP